MGLMKQLIIILLEHGQARRAKSESSIASKLPSNSAPYLSFSEATDKCSFNASDIALLSVVTLIWGQRLINDG